MSTVTKYLLRQLLAAVFLSTSVLSLLLLLGNVLKDILDLLASHSIPASWILKAVLLLFPFVLAFALPIGLLTGVLLVFGRLSADMELTALRAGGFRLLHIAVPAMGMAIVFCGICAWFNAELAPSCRVAFKDLQRKAVQSRPATTWFQPNSYTRFGDLDVYVGRQIASNQFGNLLLFRHTNGVTEQEVRAESGRLVTGTDGRIELLLQEASMLFRIDSGSNFRTGFFAELPMPLNSTAGVRITPKLSEMTFRQLQQTLADFRRDGRNGTPVLVQMHRQLAFSFASFSFALVAIPLALRTHRRETNIGLAIALLVVVVYYAFIVLGQSLETRPSTMPHLILWIPNVLFTLLGTFGILWADAQKA